MARETNNLQDLFSKDDIARMRGASGGLTLDIKDPRLKRVTRIRFLSDPGYPAWDLSYCWGETVDGEPCRVRADFLYSIPKRRIAVNPNTGRRTATSWPLKSAIYDLCKAEGIHAKNMGIFDALSTLI